MKTKVSTKAKSRPLQGPNPEGVFSKTHQNAREALRPRKNHLVEKSWNRVGQPQEKTIFVGWSWVANRSRRTKGRRAENGAKMVQFESKIYEFWTQIGSEKQEIGG